MGEHYALGTADGARGIADRRESAGFEGRDLELGRLLWKRRFDRLAPASRFGGQTENAREGRTHICESIGHAASLRHEEPRAAVFQAPGDVLRIVVHVERHDDETEPERGLIGRNPVDAVSQAQRDAIASRKALGAQVLLPARGVRGDLARGNIAPATLEKLTVKNALRRRQLRFQ